MRGELNTRIKIERKWDWLWMRLTLTRNDLHKCTIYPIYAIFFLLFLRHARLRELEYWYFSSLEPNEFSSIDFTVHCVAREGNDPEDYSRLTYRKLLEETCRFANVLKSKGVSMGDKVVIYMPMILELPIAMLACTRIGAVHNVVVSIINADNSIINANGWWS